MEVTFDFGSPLCIKVGIKVGTGGSNPVARGLRNGGQDALLMANTAPPLFKAFLFWVSSAENILTA